jgi:hypothetical protein
MAELQRYFDTFDSKIKLGRFKENKTLREKRDAVVKKLRTRLPELFKERGEKAPTFTEFDQGSYAMGTGVKPLEGDYDIDEGIFFDIRTGDHPDPLKVKRWVQDALDGHTTHPVEIKRPCVTVTYQLDKEPVYHVDLPIYAHDGVNTAMYLARGDENTPLTKRTWEQSDPIGLCTAIEDRFSDTGEAKQFRRCIRYLKRWRDIKFDARGNAAPVGIGITVAAYYWFTSERTLIDSTANSYRYNDLVALRRFIEQMINHFHTEYCDGEWVKRLSVTVPVAPKDDPFQRMTNVQMAAFREKLQKLLDALVYAEQREVEPEAACKELRKQFGDDFPVPDKDDTGTRKGPAILTSSASA